MSTAQKCPECGEKITGRVDKKFCSDQCRSAFNNRNNSDANNLVRNINNILRKNRRILEELSGGEKGKAHKDKLLAKGFSFKHFTHQYTTKKGDTYYFCYDYAYLPLNGDFYFLVKDNQNNPEVKVG